MTDEEIKEQAEKAADDARAVELYEDIVCAADGDDEVELGSWEASTIYLMLTDNEYRNKILKAHEDTYG